MKDLLLAFSFLLLAGCAAATPQADQILSAAPSGNRSAQVSYVPFIEQKTGHCGPATLTMVMNWAGKNVSVDELVPEVYTPGMKGSFQADMIAASRRHGLTAIPISGMNALLREVHAGHPVIVFENLALSWLPQWHYAVVFGYDLDKQIVLMHSGPEPFKKWDMRKFERSWQLADYWGLVVLPPDELAASADEFSHVRAGAAFEQIGKLEEAEKLYNAILARWPESLGAQIGAANVAFSHNNKDQAISHLKRATISHPESAIAWHNLAVALRAENKMAEAKHSAQEALKLAPAEAKAQYAENLKDLVF